MGDSGTSIIADHALLRFQIREILRRAYGVTVQDKVFILKDEARFLKEHTQTKVSGIGNK